MKDEGNGKHGQESQIYRLFHSPREIVLPRDLFNLGKHHLQLRNRILRIRGNGQSVSPIYHKLMSGAGVRTVKSKSRSLHDKITSFARYPAVQFVLPYLSQYLQSQAEGGSILDPGESSLLKWNVNRLRTGAKWKQKQ